MSDHPPVPGRIREIADAALPVVCTVCHHHGHDPCAGDSIMHFARFSRARDQGLIGASELDAVLRYIGEDSLYARPVPL